MTVAFAPVGVASFTPALMPTAPVAADLDQADRILADALAGYRTRFGPLVDHLKHYRGKRLRPTLLLLSARASGRVTSAHHTLAACVEMIHTATLVHDDVLDGATTRRHVPTVNANWGNEVSILLGDMLFSHAFRLAATVDVRACQVIGDATNRVCAGELKQVTDRGNLHLTEAEYFAQIDGKTAALTECCGRLGAEYAGGNGERISQYGRNLGLAFQVADDLLDLTGDESTAGKTLGTDLDQRKLTLPLIHCLANLPTADEFRDRLRTGDLDRAYVIDRLRETDSLGYAKRRADGFARAAREQLAGLPHSDARTVLEQMAEWSTRRQA
jgi:octaprenyl-diphosphate synthase